MKQPQLNDVMQRFTITAHENGYEVSNQAGTAQYDSWGARTTVNGIPEYFPRSISVKDGTKPDAARTDGEVAFGGFPDAAKVQAKKFKVYKAEMNISVDLDKGNLDKLEAQLKRIADLRQGIESPRLFLTCQDEQRIREEINKAITKALQQGGSLHKSMRG